MKTAMNAATNAETGGGLDVVVSGPASDAHTWNLVYLQLVLEELGHRVRNLGACVPDDLLVSECARHRPDLIVISSVNGHGRHEGLRIIRRLRDRPELASTPTVLGGKLGIDGPHARGTADPLLAAGFDAVFEDGGAGLPAFRAYLDTIRIQVRA